VQISGHQIPIAKYSEENIVFASTTRLSWRVELQPQTAGGPRTVQITSELLGSIALKDVLFGDVFLCGGQSNMAMGMSDAHREDQESVNQAAADGGLDKIRIFSVLTNPTAGQPPIADSLNILHSWLPVTNTSIYGPSCSAQILKSTLYIDSYITYFTFFSPNKCGAEMALGIRSQKYSLHCLHLAEYIRPLTFENFCQDAQGWTWCRLSIVWHVYYPPHMTHMYPPLHMTQEGWTWCRFSIVCLTFGIRTFHLLHGARPIGLFCLYSRSLLPL
jgi:hypothetical protein